MDDSFWDEIARAKQLTGAQKMTDSLRLFDQASRRILAGIKAQYPGVSDEEARRIRAERLEILRRFEELK